MARKKKTRHGVHKEPRSPVQIPVSWLKVARKLAAKKEKPTQWFLISLLRDAAIAEGETDLPPGPWDEKPEE